MRKAAPAAALLAATAVALTAHAPSAVQAASILAEYPQDKLAKHVSYLEAMSEADLEKNLRQVFSPSMPKGTRKMFPEKAVDTMKKMLDKKEKITDEKKRDVDFVMKRYALLFGRMVFSCTEFEEFGQDLRNPSLTPKQYNQKVVGLESMVSICSSSVVHLVGYLRHAVKDLRKKWGTKADEKRQRDVLEFIDQLGALYEQQLAVSEVDAEMARAEFLKHADKPADLEQLRKEASYKELQKKRSGAEWEYRSRSIQAEASAASSVENGMILTDYLSLLFYVNLDAK
ncbi:hypothetical protein Emed_007097 [Eimeria media]